MKRTPSREDSNDKRVPRDLVIPGPNKLPKGIIPTSWPQPWGENDRIRTFPYHGWDGRVSTWKKRLGNVPKDQRYRPNKSGPFAYKPEDAFLPYGLPKLRRAMYEGVETIFWTTGPTDTEAIWQADHCATSFFSSETRIKPEHVDVLRRLKEETGWDGQMVLCVDDDPTGYQMLPAWLAAFDSVFSNVVPVIPLVGKDVRDHLGADYGLEDLVPLGPEGWDQRAFMLLADDEITRKEIQGGYKVRCFVDGHDDNNPSVDMVRGEKATLIRDRVWIDDPKEHDKHIEEGLKARGLTWAMLKYRNRDGSLVGAEDEKAKKSADSSGESKGNYCPPPSGPMECARFIADKFQDANGDNLVRYYDERFWRYRDGYWAKITDNEMRNELFKIMDKQFMKVQVEGEWQTVRWAPTVGKIQNLFAAVRSLYEEDAEPGSWTGEPIEGTVIPVRNGLLSLDDRKLHPHTPRFFNIAVASFNYDPKATCPRWDSFLADVFEHDPEGARALKQWFGYNVSRRTDLEKMLLMTGPTRGGRGTIGEVLHGLMGAEFAGLTFSSLAGEFGLEKLLGKTTAVVGDSRSAARRDEHGMVIERLLSISSGDPLPVNRKNKSELPDVKFRTRITVFSNELPSFTDAGGALTNRWLIIPMTKSFLGKEDRTLKSTLLKQMPGILNYALDGYDDLEKEGKLLQPASGVVDMETMSIAESPHKLFMEDCLILGPDESSILADMTTDWKSWCATNGEQPGNPNHLMRNLLPVIRAAGGQLERGKGKLKNTWFGVGLKSKQTGNPNVKHFGGNK
ncbi:phage/plasmid primase, P4 family [Streptomyces nigra]|uniref:DNA primase family protein n=1 Tax=Streptomyces nigra TaxID=1827580 RepID=UPI0034565797